MPSDARILREGGIEELRAHWREKQRRRRPPPREYAEKNCDHCGTSFQPKNDEHRWCNSRCRVTAHRRLRGRPPEKYRPSPLRLRYANCLNCRELRVLHGGQGSCRQPECQSWQHRVVIREYMRRTRYAATRYWRIADTPEARKLAETYFDLRMELRPSGKHKQEWRRYYAAKHPRNPEHAVGAGPEPAKR